MAVKKKKISEYDAANSLVGLWTLGYSISNGLRKTVRVSLEFIKTAFDNVVKATSDAIAATNASKSQTESATKAEAARVTAEDSRVSAETTRENSEKTRVSQETGRVNVEKNRVTAETGRVSAEKSRVNAETGRVDAEKNRVTAESGRVDTEKSRVTAETGRINAEKQRVDDTTQRLNDADDAIDRLNDLSDHPAKIVDGYWHLWDEAAQAYVSTGEQASGNVLYATFEVDPATGELFQNTDDLYDGPTFELENGNLNVII